MQTTILVVDDDTAIRQLLADVLQDDGYRVVTADRGQSALWILANRHPDLVLIDLALPDMDGLALSQHIRTQMPTLPMIFMSASVVHASIPTSGLFLAKPFDLDEVLYLVASALARPLPTYGGSL